MRIVGRNFNNATIFKGRACNDPQTNRRRRETPPREVKWKEFQEQDRVRIVGQEMRGVVVGVGKRKISVLLRDGQYDGVTIQLPPQCLLHVFDATEKYYLINGGGVNA